MKIKVSGNFAVLEASATLGTQRSSDLMQSQMRALYDCHLLGHPSGDDLAITVTSDENVAMSSLAVLAQRYRVLIVRLVPWPGNLVKLYGNAEALRALINVTNALPARATPTRQARVLLTDCCDVLFRKDAACFGGGEGRFANDVFDRFTEIFARRGERVVFSAERGTSMLMSQDEYVKSNDRIKSSLEEAREPPQGWLVPIHAHYRDNFSKAVQRKRHFSHKPTELPPNPLLHGSGTPDVCLEALCLHQKSVNSGLVIGDLEPLTEAYEETIRLCGVDCDLKSGNSTSQSSDQNPLGHYLIASRFCGRRCSLDYNFTLFHTIQQNAPVYGLLGLSRVGTGLQQDVQVCNETCTPRGSGYQELFIHIPVAKHIARNVTSRDVITSRDWVALSPEVFTEAWFPIQACALHAAGLPNPLSPTEHGNQSHNLELLREGLGVPMRPSPGLRQVSVSSDGRVEPLLASSQGAQPSKAVGLMRHG